ncbi:MAG: thiamine pyrophosphate-dependent dehydrogenase E1 component subunit alpha [Bacteroidota bacterium]
MSDLTNDELKEMLKKMYQIRKFEEKVNEMFMQGKIHGTTHLGIGQEACAVGAIQTLRKEDYIFSNHRGHGHCIAKGANIDRMMAELFGRETGFCKGLGGSMHIVDVKTNNMGANGVVGGGIPLATGAALALKKKKSDKVVLNIFGDASTNLGIFHESLNLAAIWKLPVIYICENNMYGMSTPIAKTMAVPNVADRAAAYNISGVICDGNDVLAVYDTVKQAVEKARSGKGPTLVELKTYRQNGHSKSDQRAYRTREEEAEWKAKCPIKRFSEYLIASKVMTADEVKSMEAEAENEIEQSVKYAESCNVLPLEKLLGEVYA